ncbi:D-inositol-3-phosphate glycosyltransferase [Turicibacter sanguinis]|nr:D-inositol-3-phosphate glycosyltransferase [Turicibacter sanguinis]
MKKKVLFVATVVKTHINTFHLPYLEWFRSEGYETHVAAKNDFKNDELCVIPYCDVFYDIPFERSPLNLKNLEAYRELKKVIDTNNYDIIHCHTPVGALLTRIAARKFRKKGTKVIYTAHGFHFFKGAPILNWLIYFPVEFICSFFTDVLITINQEDYCLAKKVMKARKIEYIPGVGIDISKYQNVKVDKKAKRKELGIPEHAMMLLSVGELNKNKNHEVIIEAMNRLNNPNIYYCIAGQGELKDYLKNKIISLGLENQVHLLGYRRDISELCCIADIFCFPSFREGLSVSLMEAMCAGLPVICSDIRGNSDLIDKDGGYRCNPKSADDFSVRINELVKNEDKKVYYQNNNLEAIKKFSIEAVKKEMICIYNK